jgi:hypothetical protein
MKRKERRIRRQGSMIPYNKYNLFDLYIAIQSSFSSMDDVGPPIFLIGPWNHLCAERTQEMDAKKKTPIIITTA